MRSGLLLISLIAIVASTPLRADRAESQAAFKLKRAGLKGQKIPGPYVELGNWCLAQPLKREARWCFERAHTFEAGHAGARTGMNQLGYDLDGKRYRPIRSIYSKRRRRLRRTDAAGRYALAGYIRRFGLTMEADKELGLVLRIDRHHKQARAELGYTRLYGQWLTRKQVQQEQALDQIWQAGLRQKKAAKPLHAELKAAGYKQKLAEVKRVLTLVGSPRGKQQDVKLADNKFPRGDYTYGVPRTYKLWRKNKLIVFLHGGGAGVGDGDDYFPQIWPHSGPRGYLTICPTVLEKVALAWNNPTHEQYLREILKQFALKYNVDPRRTYLMGHSMGGFGCFYHGTRMTDLFAAISPWSGAPGRSALGKLKLTPTYVIHGNRDKQVNVAGSRRAGKVLNKQSPHHVYVELSIPGHGIPRAEQAKAVDWLDRWALDPRAGRKRK